MNSKQLSANLMVALLVIGIVSAVGLSVPTQNAAAQNVTIETSADSHGDIFFGEGLLQVVIDDPDADDDDATEDIQVDIEGTITEDDTASSTGTFTVFETSDSSGTFEFYLAHEDADNVVIGDLDTIDTSGAVEFDGVTESAQVIRWGTGEDLDLSAALFQEVRFEITVGDTTIVVNYEPDDGDIELDREVFGTDSVIHITIVDQDANNDPTNRDLLNYSETELNDDLFSLIGADFNDEVDGIEFEEEGDNNARFEAVLQLNDTASDDDDELIVSDDSVQVTLNDQSDYFDLTNTENDQTTDTDDTDFGIDNQDGTLSDLGDVTFSTELKFTLTDNDRNTDSQIEDDISDSVLVCTETAEVDGGDCAEVTLEETDENTGIFQLDTSNQEVKVDFIGDDEEVISTNDILELRENTTTDDILITYTDPRSSDDIEETFEQEISLNIASPSIDLPETSGINDDFTVTVTDGNLNDNPRTKDTYTITLDGDGPHPLLRGGEDLGSLVTFEVEIESAVADFGDGITETLTETGINTGVFTVGFDMEDILASADADVDDGDSVEFTINDFFDDQSHEASDELSIGKASTGVDFSRTVLPIPPEEDTDTAIVLDATTVLTTLTITDPDQNFNSNTEDTIPFQFQDDADADEPSFVVEVDGDGSDNDETITNEADYTGSLLEEILPGLTDITLAETGRTSGVFDEELEFQHGSLDTDEWQDLEITFTYIDADGDEEESGMTFRGNDGSVTVDQASVTAGAIITITVQDEDLNLDDDTAEEFEGATPESTEDNPEFLLLVETEDDEIAGTTTETFRETGTDTGIFTATYRVGEDIPVTDQEENDDEVTQATNILITYNDEVDASGGSGDEIEVNIPVVTSTGAILVQPELVGPGTEITVTITDQDLNSDASGADNYDPADVGIDPDSDDFFVNFRSDRDEVGDASPEIEETGANTGVFTFTIELETDESACEDDDLSEDKFDASGGSEPSIGACPGDLLAIEYEDEQDGSGRSTVVSQVVEVRSFDPEFVPDKDEYAAGDRITVSISDPDANRNPNIADSLTDITVSSETDRVGEEFSALETGRNTGVFRLTFATSLDSSSGALTVKTGDTVTVEYTDEFPADFEEQEDDKDFTFTIDIGGVVGTGSTTPSAPSVKDPTGGVVDEIKANQQVVLSTTINNNIGDELPFTAIIEVRNSDGVTVYLAWQTGVLNPNGRAEVGLSWTPEESGDYDIRTFIISDLANPRILSDVKESSISVS